MIVQIDIERRIPIINGFVQPPDSQILLSNKLTSTAAEAVIAGSSTTQIGGSIRTDRDWFILPAFDREDAAPSDFFQTLRDEAESA